MNLPASVVLDIAGTTLAAADRRRLTVSLTEAGTGLYSTRVATALQISAETVAPLTREEARTLQALLSRLT